MREDSQLAVYFAYETPEMGEIYEDVQLGSKGGPDASAITSKTKNASSFTSETFVSPSLFLFGLKGEVLLRVTCVSSACFRTYLSSAPRSSLLERLPDAGGCGERESCSRSSDCQHNGNLS
jgi:hypothetical protein